IGSTLASRYIAATVCAILSATVGTPSTRTPPAPDFFGISTALTGAGKYVPELIRFQSLYRLFFNSCSNSWRDCPSTPPAPSLALTRRYVSHTTCFEIANGFGLGLAGGSSCFGSCPPSKPGWPVPFARPALPGVLTTAEQSATACPATVRCSLRIWPLGGLPFAPGSAIGLPVRSVGVAASHVPRWRLNRARAAYMPDAAWAASRFPPGCSRVPLPPRLRHRYGPFSTRPQRFTFVRLPGSHLTPSRAAFSTTLTTPALGPAQ